MIRFYAQGGLGNQMFQYAAARRLALKHGVPLVIDPFWFDHPLPGETPRRFELGAYKVELRVASAAEQRSWRHTRGRLGPLLMPFQPFQVLRERGTGLDRRLLEAGCDAYLIGFWQSESYFSDVRQELLGELVMQTTPSPNDEGLVAAMADCASISLHVRRGDYVSLVSAASFHGTCSIEYYRSAVAHISARVQHPVLFVFSDDPEWCCTHLQFEIPTYYVSQSPGAGPHRDLWLMSRCQHNIIANSSFSWWGAWLGDARSRIVVAPKRWYAEGRHTPDLIPTRWTTL